MRKVILFTLLMAGLAMTGCVTERYHQNDIEYLQRQINDLDSKIDRIDGYLKGKEVK